MRLRFFMLIVLALFTVTIVAQTDNPPAIWAFDEQCVGERSAPPLNWTFDGAVLLTGQYGIHAIDNNVTTPYVVAFLSDVVPGGITPGLSSDQRYYAVVRGTQDLNQPINARVWNIFEVRLYSTNEFDEDIVYAVDQSYEYFIDPFGRVYVRWLDSERLLYTTETGILAPQVESEVIHLFSSENPVVDWQNAIDPILLPRSVFFPAPDWERAVFNASESPFDPAQWQVIDIETSNVVTEPDLADFIEPVWAPDSTQFVAEIEQETDDDFVYTLALFNAEGSLTERIITFDAGERVRASFDANMHHVRWSSDGRYLAFITSTVSFPTSITLYVADTQTRTVTNTCLWTENGIAWSPDSTQIALFPRLIYDPRQELLIFDMEDWALYDSGRRHDGNVIGWRE